MATYPNTVLADSPLDYWQLNESVGNTTATDSAGSNNGTYTGTPTLGSAALINNPADTAVTFTATTTYVLCKSGFLLAGLTNWSIEAWIKTSTTANANGNPIWCERAASGNDILKWQQTDGSQTNNATTATMEIVYRDDAGTLNRFASTTAINDNHVHYVAITKSGTTFTFYLDGVSDGTATQTATNTFTNASPSSRIASDAAGGAAAWGGEIGEVAIYNVALSAAQISAHYAARNPSVAPTFTPRRMPLGV